MGAKIQAFDILQTLLGSHYLLPLSRYDKYLPLQIYRGGDGLFTGNH
jgi:hypothetical protein